MFKQVRSGWPKAIRSIQNSVNPGPTISFLYLKSSMGRDWSTYAQEQ